MSARRLSLTKRVLAAATCALVAAATPAAAHLIDTGAPNGQIIPALAFDANDFYAGQVVFAGAATIDDVFAHVLGGTAGETFTIALYDDSATHAPGDELFASTATFTADGWNGVTGLTGWNVAAGTYWVAFEIDFGDTLGSGSDTGALLDIGAPQPLAATAFDPGSGYQRAATPASFGLELDASVATVPEPDTVALVFGGLGLALALGRRRFGGRSTRR